MDDEYIEPSKSVGDGVDDGPIRKMKDVGYGKTALPREVDGNGLNSFTLACHPWRVTYAHASCEVPLVVRGPELWRKRTVSTSLSSCLVTSVPALNLNTSSTLLSI